MENTLCVFVLFSILLEKFGSVQPHSEREHLALYHPSGKEQVPLGLMHISRESSDMVHTKITLMAHVSRAGAVSRNKHRPGAVQNTGSEWGESFPSLLFLCL